MGGWSKKTMSKNAPSGKTKDNDFLRGKCVLPLVVSPYIKYSTISAARAL